MTNSQLALLTLVIAGLPFAIGCRGETAAGPPPIRKVRAMIVADYDGISQRSFPGRAAATQEVDLAFRVAGPLITFPVKVGDEVEQGGLVASIDPRDFEVALRNAEGHLERGVASARLAQVDLDRLSGLGPTVVAQAEIDEAQRNLEVAESNISALEASADSARDALGYANLYAPFSGTVVATYVENFQNVQAKEMIVRLLDKSRIEFEVSIPETMISMVPYVEEIQVRFDAFPDLAIPAEVSEIGTEASQTTRTFPVTLIMDQPDDVMILPGMAGRAAGTARPPGSEQTPEIVIPETAVFSPQVEDKGYVWVIDPATNTAKRREVSLGKIISTGYVVTDGLSAEEIIATAGVHFLSEGQEVNPTFQ